MRTGLLALLLVACAAPEERPAALPASFVTPEHVDARVVESPTVPVTAVSTEGCVIRGSGETWGQRTRPFRVYASRADAEPMLIVAEPRNVHVAWSSLPRAGTNDARALASFGGQSLVRLSAWSDLAGRRFELKDRATVARDHIWVRGGRVVEVLGLDGEQVVVSSPTELVAPTTVHAHTSCDNVVYQPEGPPEEKLAGGADDVLLAHVAHLYDEPHGTQLLAVTTDYMRATKVSSANGFVRVTSSTDTIVFDAWVPQSDLVRDRGLGNMHGFGMTGGCSCGFGWSRIGTVERDSPLRVSISPNSAVVGSIERGARVAVMEETVFDHEAWLSVVFVSREIEPASGKHMWIAKRDFVQD